ncbi:MAG: protein kinase, partial [Myxococcales bacterium]|nr:protein kinase [Myxococcales bacterium]
MSSTAARGRVKLHQCLGAGGFGEVYLGTLQKEGGTQRVAVKVLKQGLDARSQAVQRLRDEARLLHILEHPNILEVYDLVVLDGRVALISEFVRGQDLEELLIPPDRIPVAAGLE